LSTLGAAVGWGLVVGGSLLAGALAAAYLRLPSKVAAGLTALGGGIMFAAVALELVPESDANAGAALTALGLLAGALGYVAADRWLSRDEDRIMMRRAGRAAAAGHEMHMPSGRAEAARGESIAAGLTVDGVPESVALGLTIAEGEIGVALLVGIALGNVVEAYGAAQPIIAGGHTRGFAVRLLGMIGLALLLATVLGATVLSDASDELIGFSQALAAGAVLAVISVAISPHAFKEVSRFAAVATVSGFILGYLLSSGA
jgi:zinc transporter, ZIP family